MKKSWNKLKANPLSPEKPLFIMIDKNNVKNLDFCLISSMNPNVFLEILENTGEIRRHPVWKKKMRIAHF